MRRRSFSKRGDLGKPQSIRLRRTRPEPLKHIVFVANSAAGETKSGLNSSLEWRHPQVHVADFWPIATNFGDVRPPSGTITAESTNFAPKSTESRPNSSGTGQTCGRNQPLAETVWGRTSLTDLGLSFIDLDRIRQIMGRLGPASAGFVPKASEFGPSSTELRQPRPTSASFSSNTRMPCFVSWGVARQMLQQNAKTR